ncbi:MAG: hypothetical protein ACKV22_04320 [Bryobacteraceae bacterium]
MLVYTETFDDGPGGWQGWINNFAGPKKLEYRPGAVTSRSPWWIDYNHAPPGAGYLHMLFGLGTKGPGFGEAQMEAGGENHFVEGGYPTNFTSARVTLKLKGELEARGAQLVLLAQGTQHGICSGWAMTGRPFHVTTEWTEETIQLDPDPALWTPLGSRHNRTRSYGIHPLETVLADVSNNIILILFPLTIVPMGPLEGDPHRLRPGGDYPVWTSRLPEGYVVLDEIRIEFPNAA